MFASNKMFHTFADLFEKRVCIFFCR